MATSAIYDLSDAVWIPVTGQSVAKNVPNGYYVVYEPDGTRFYIIGNLEYAGWLAKHSVPVLPIAAPFNATLTFNLRPDDAAAIKGESWEFDLMYSDANGNVGNGSGQLNIQKGGKWQIIIGGQWVDIPGFDPGIPSPDVDTPVTVSCHFDPLKELSSITGVRVGSAVATIPAAMQNQPFVKLGWAPNLLVVQVQQNVIQTGGAFSFKIGTGMRVETYWL